MTCNIGHMCMNIACVYPGPRGFEVTVIKKWGCLKARVIHRKPTLMNVTQRFLFPPCPSRKKTSTTHPKRLSIKTSSSPMNCPRGRFLRRPHLRMNCADLTEDSCPGRIIDHVLAPSRTRISRPPDIEREQTIKCSPHQTEPDV